VGQRLITFNSAGMNSGSDLDTKLSLDNILKDNQNEHILRKNINQIFTWCILNYPLLYIVLSRLI
jgi:hypothetical protein